CQQYYSDSLTF
nr:immunoglobulin light chain junction region [Macaca mulatta]